MDIICFGPEGSPRRWLTVEATGSCEPWGLLLWWPTHILFLELPLSPSPPRCLGMLVPVAKEGIHTFYGKEGRVRDSLAGLLRLLVTCKRLNSAREATNLSDGGSESSDDSLPALVPWPPVTTHSHRHLSYTVPFMGRSTMFFSDTHIAGTPDHLTGQSHPQILE